MRERFVNCPNCTARIGYPEGTKLIVGECPNCRVNIAIPPGLRVWPWILRFWWSVYIAQMHQRIRAWRKRLSDWMFENL